MGQTGATERGWLDEQMPTPENRSGTDAGSSRLDCEVCDLSMIVKTELREGEMVRCFRCDAFVRETTD